MPEQSFWAKVRPWQCDECGQKNISANKAACPTCFAPRPGTEAAEAEAATGQRTRTYEHERDMQAGIARMAKLGWRVQSQSVYQPGAGVGRVLALGLFAAVIKPNAHFTVVYERA